MFKMYRYVLNVDDLGNRVVSKIIFAVMFLIKFFSLVAPIGDSNFQPLFRWLKELSEDSDMMMNATLDQMPISVGNMVYFFFQIGIYYLMICGAMLYCGLFIRHYRNLYDRTKIKNLPMPIKSGDFFLRYMIICLILGVIFIPLLIMVLYLPFIFIIISPCVFMYIASYFSGDSDIISALMYSIRRTKGFFLIIARDVSWLILIYVLASSGLRYLAQYQPVMAYVVEPFVMVFVFLVLGRYIGYIYSKSVEVSGLIIRRRINNGNDTSSK